MIVVKSATYLSDYKIQITFSDGVQKIVDLASSLTGQMFEPLFDLELFTQFRVDPESETILWPNGADMAPEYLYRIGQTSRASQNAPEPS